MNHQGKISKAFDPFMSDSGPHDKREAIVIYRSPQVEQLPEPIALRASRIRSAFVNECADRQKAVHGSIVEGYEKEGPRRLKEKVELSTQIIHHANIKPEQACPSCRVGSEGYRIPTENG